jgi:hypothetical protein
LSACAGVSYPDFLEPGSLISVAAPNVSPNVLFGSVAGHSILPGFISGASFSPLSIFCFLLFTFRLHGHSAPISLAAGRL